MIVKRINERANMQTTSAMPTHPVVKTLIKIILRMIQTMRKVAIST